MIGRLVLIHTERGEDYGAGKNFCILTYVSKAQAEQ